MIALPLVDRLRDLMPLGDAALNVKADDGGSQPARSKPNTLYAWPTRLGPQVLADAPQGRVVDTFLRVSLLYTLGARGEPRVLRRERAISEALDTWVELALQAIADNKRDSGGLWWDAFVEAITYDATRSDEHRGVGMTVMLRMNTPPAIGV